ncbi:hypothetical protein LTR04_005579 [Oleoguttula sp. CCFEE 6159]|nr:hypothetical protein LTR04_005579 [Oleoguttula sp. CCFEE 6159]
MASSFEKSVKGGTKIKLAAPKSKYVEHILVATQAGEAGVAEVFRSLQNRLRDSTWTIAFKSLIIVHFMIKEGEPDVTLKYIAASPKRTLAINHFTDVQTQGQNIRCYSEYLSQRAVSYGQTRVDYVRSGEGRLKRLNIDKGLLRETESVQSCIKSLLKCDMLSSEPENDITMCAFRLLTADLLALFHVMNEAVINVLEHYFEISKPDAERALRIYKVFAKQTDQVVSYLQLARSYEQVTRIQIPKLKHAPTSLATKLEDYLNSDDFEANRRYYVTQQEARKGNKAKFGTNRSSGGSRSAPSKPAADQSFPSPKVDQAAPAKQETRGPAPDLIDFFDSIEQDQRPMAETSQAYQQPSQFGQQAAFLPQQNAFPPQTTSFQTQQQFNPAVNQSTNPFGKPQQHHHHQPPQQASNGAEFGIDLSQPQTAFPQDRFVSFTSHPQPQQQHYTGMPAEQIQPQSTNPFRQSFLPSSTGTSPTTNRQNTNPFARNSMPQVGSAMTGAAPFNPSPPPQLQNLSESPFPPQQNTPQQQHNLQPLQPVPTGTNPFARQPAPNAQHPQQAAQPLLSPQALVPNPTGSTNPFRQSQFVNQQTGQGWQAGPQLTMGGLEQLKTVPVFPRPGQPQQQQGWL